MSIGGTRDARLARAEPALRRRAPPALPKAPPEVPLELPPGPDFALDAAVRCPTPVVGLFLSFVVRGVAMATDCSRGFIQMNAGMTDKYWSQQLPCAW